MNLPFGSVKVPTLLLGVPLVPVPVPASVAAVVPPPPKDLASVGRSPVKGEPDPNPNLAQLQFAQRLVFGLSGLFLGPMPSAALGLVMTSGATDPGESAPPEVKKADSAATVVTIAITLPALFKAGKDLVKAAWDKAKSTFGRSTTGPPPGTPPTIPVRKGPIPDELPHSLPEQLVLKKAKSGGGKEIIPSHLLGDKPRLEANYGPGEWVKMEVKHVTPDGKQINVHWFKNKSTGQVEEFKFKIREADKIGYDGTSLKGNFKRGGVGNPPPSVPIPPGAPEPIPP